jgi:hypothetical protein
MQETIMKLGAVTIRGRRMKFGAVTAGPIEKWTAVAQAANI